MMGEPMEDRTPAMLEKCEEMTKSCRECYCNDAKQTQQADDPTIRSDDPTFTQEAFEPDAYDTCVCTSYGACANHSSETKFADPFNHALLLTATGSVGKIYQGNAYFAMQSIKEHASICKPIELGYEAVVMLSADIPGSTVLRHIFFAKFKPAAPMEDLISGYFGLTNIIKEMKCFEYGKLDGQAVYDSGGFEYLFMTTFESAKDRDLYLEHPEHVKFAAHIFSFIEKIHIMDF